MTREGFGDALQRVRESLEKREKGDEGSRG